MTTTVKRRTRTPKERLRALDQKFAKLSIDKRLTAETKKQIREMRAQIPAALEKSEEVQKSVARCGNLFIRLTLLVRKHGHFRLA